MIRSFDGMTPQIADSARVDETAVVIGDVIIASEASVWPNATIRGDNEQIVVGERANVQDGAVLHEDAVLSRETTVGHGGIVHAATVERGALVGMNAVVLDDATIGEGSIVAAGSVVTEGTDVPPETLVVGAPAEPKADLADADPAETARGYVELAERYEQTARRIDP